ncbi:aldose epimerase family protein [Roseibium sp.]|uniref:aldose epimerase family protein n=1 Tax=Roseibium sp. TaxID=1936156 RepID=UPI003B51EF0A
MDVFGEMPDGIPVKRISLEGGGLTASFLTYGTVLQDLRLEGHAAPLVLGFETFDPYLTKSPYFGATAGRYANRIRDGHLEIDGKTYQLDQNFLGKHALHGGAVSMGKRMWRLEESSKSAAVFAIDLADGEMGFPGNLKAEARFSLLKGGVLDIVYSATTDAPTLCNLAHHSYFNLGSDTVLEHQLQIKADHYLPVNEELIPTGEIAPVEGTPFDFRKLAPVAQGGASGTFDHNFCISPDHLELRDVAVLRNPSSGVTMRCRTTEPGLQIYDGARIDIDEPGLGGMKMGAHAGIALEPQIWPDAPHHPDFPSALLRPGETYRQHSQYIFELDRP